MIVCGNQLKQSFISVISSQINYYFIFVAKQQLNFFFDQARTAWIGHLGLGNWFIVVKLYVSIHLYCNWLLQILERSIKLLFTTRDVSQVKLFVQRQCTKLMMGSAGIQDFIFAKEYRGASGYQPGACVPALEIARFGVL